MPGEMRKRDRSKHAAKIARALTTAGYDMDLLRDALADMMHYCAVHGEDFEAELESARNHFDAERKP